MQDDQELTDSNLKDHDKDLLDTGTTSSSSTQDYNLNEKQETIKEDIIENQNNHMGDSNNSSSSRSDQLTRETNFETRSQRENEISPFHKSSNCVEPPKDSTKNPTSNQKNSNHSSLSLILAIIALLCGLTSLVQTRQALNQGANSPRQATGRDSNSANFTEGSIASVANSVSKSVVSIVVNTNQTSFFGGYTSGQTAAGTGFILSNDGYIATNKHVVANASKIGVVLDDGTTYDNVELIGTDPLNDFAIIRIKDVKDLTPVKLGDSKTTSTGQQVVAIGNALGAYQNSVTSGIISGKGRNINASDSSRTQYETLSDMIQTDAAINGGNSGGPLVNAAGEVIGINTAYASQGNNVGFAIPISSIKGIIKHVLAGQPFERAVIGVRYVSINPAMAKEKNLPVKQGAYLGSNGDSQAVASGSAGEKAGLKEGDIITSINGIEIGASGSLSSLIGEYSVGETISIGVLRDKKPLNLQLTLTAYKK